MAANPLSPLSGGNVPPNFPSSSSSSSHPEVDPAISSGTDLRTLFEQVKKDEDRRLEAEVVQLPQAQQQEVQLFRKDLASLKDCFEKLQQDPSSLEDEFEQLKAQLVGSYHVNDLFLDTLSPENEPIYNDYLFEVTKNTHINTILYRNEINTFVEQQKGKIVETMHPAILSTVSLDEIVFYVTFKDVDQSDEGALRRNEFLQETHHYGKAPAFIHFYSKEKSPLFKVVYKPRDSKTDEAVIQTFVDINNLDEGDKSSSFPLPTYKILCYDDRSIWEYVGGKHIKKTETANTFINKQFKKSKSCKQEAKLVLNRLDAILTKMGIADLHYENIKINICHGSPPIEIIPIDCENYQPALGRTELGGTPNAITLKPAEEQAINTFLKKIKRNEEPISSRYLPLTSQRLGNVINTPKNAEPLSERLLKSMQEDKIHIVMDKTQLQILLISSILNHDVPYFSQCGNTIYYGRKSAGAVVGTLPEEDQEKEKWDKV